MAETGTSSAIWWYSRSIKHWQSHPGENCVTYPLKCHSPYTGDCFMPLPLSSLRDTKTHSRRNSFFSSIPPSWSIKIFQQRALQMQTNGTNLWQNGDWYGPPWFNFFIAFQNVKASLPIQPNKFKTCLMQDKIKKKISLESENYCSWVRIQKPEIRSVFPKQIKWRWGMQKSVLGNREIWQEAASKNKSERARC